MNLKPDYFFCYSPTLSKFLHSKKGFSFICMAKNVKDDRTFWLFERGEELNKALTEYKELLG